MLQSQPVHLSYTTRRAGRCMRVGLLWLLLPVFLLWLLAGCASAPPPPVTTPVALTLVAAPDVNPDSQGRASPVVLRVYALKAAGSFESADFFSLQDRDTEILGADLDTRKEMVLRPGDQTGLEFEFDADVNALGFVAGYRDLNHARWRQVLPLTVGSEMAVTATLAADGIDVQVR